MHAFYMKYIKFLRAINHFDNTLVSFEGKCVSSSMSELCKHLQPVQKASIVLFCCRNISIRCHAVFILRFYIIECVGFIMCRVESIELCCLPDNIILEFSPDQL